MVNLIFMKVSSYFIKETILFSTNGAGRMDINMPKVYLNSFFTLHTKINSKLDHGEDSVKMAE